MNRKTDIAARFAAAALGAALMTTPTTAFAQPAHIQCASCAASFRIALADSGLAAFEVTVTDLESYVNANGDYVDHVRFDAYGMTFDYEIEHFTGHICKVCRYRC